MNSTADDSKSIAPTRDELDDFEFALDAAPDYPRSDELAGLDRLLLSEVDLDQPPTKPKRVWPESIRKRIARAASEPLPFVTPPKKDDQAGRDAMVAHYQRIEAAMSEHDRFLDSRDRAERLDRAKIRPKSAHELAERAELDAEFSELLRDLSTFSGDGEVETNAVSTSTPGEACSETPAPPGRIPSSSASTAEKSEADMESLVTGCEQAWHPTPGDSVGDRRSESPEAPSEPGSATTADENKPSLRIDVAQVIDDKMATIRTMRWTWDAFQAYRNLRQLRPLIRKLSKRVFSLGWQSDARSSEEKNFPFLPITSSSCFKRGCNAFKEEWEIPHQPHPEREIPVAKPACPVMPAWNKLPASEKRPSSLRELVAGVRFASVAFQGNLTPEDWAHTVPGSDVMCLSIDLQGEAAKRFLDGEGGDVGKSLKRRLLRRLDVRGQYRDVTAAAVWTRPAGSTSCDVRVFIMFQQDSAGAAGDVVLEDRNRRFWRTLQQHKVTVSPDDMPLKVLGKHLAPHLGMSVDELNDLLDSDRFGDEFPAEIQEYTPEEGFASTEELDRRIDHSFAKWARFTSRHGVPAWISSTFMKRIEDYFFFSPEHTGDRDRLEALKKKAAGRRFMFSKAKRLALTTARLKKLSPGEICLFRGSPAQFAAIAIRDGEWLGDYCDSAHKAGRARDLYESIRAEWVETP